MTYLPCLNAPPGLRLENINVAVSKYEVRGLLLYCLGAGEGPVSMPPGSHGFAECHRPPVAFCMAQTPPSNSNRLVREISSSTELLTSLWEEGALEFLVGDGSGSAVRYLRGRDRMDAHSVDLGVAVANCEGLLVFTKGVAEAARSLGGLVASHLNGCGFIPYVTLVVPSEDIVASCGLDAAGGFHLRHDVGGRPDPRGRFAVRDDDSVVEGTEELWASICDAVGVFGWYWSIRQECALSDDDLARFLELSGPTIPDSRGRTIARGDHRRAIHAFIAMGEATDSLQQFIPGWAMAFLDP